ncbi:glucokinase, partial [Rhizobium leguminosarum]|uniref:glucokinase n=1 Tax=Rhizobium leguminosarum TaxID=384 RepID=UPI003F9BAD5E
MGGTNARFSILTDAYAEPKQFPNVRTADFATIDEAIQQCVLDKTAVQPRSAILAVAGPIIVFGRTTQSQLVSGISSSLIG